jgi:hypothetical protein
VRESNLGGLNRKLPQRRMNTWGEISNRCVVGNSADRNRKLAEVMMLAKSLEEVNQAQQVSQSRTRKRVKLRRCMRRRLVRS